jgi:hypothetical protein
MDQELTPEPLVAPRTCPGLKLSAALGEGAQDVAQGAAVVEVQVDGLGAETSAIGRVGDDGHGHVKTQRSAPDAGDSTSANTTTYVVKGRTLLDNPCSTEPQCGHGHSMNTTETISLAAALLDAAEADDYLLADRARRDLGSDADFRLTPSSAGVA